MTRQVNCPMCKAACTLTVAGKFREHGPKGNRCEMSGCFLPAELQEPLPPRSPSGNKDEAPCLPEISRNSPDTTDPATSATCTNDSDSPIPSVTSTTQPSLSSATATTTTYEQPDRMQSARGTPVPMTPLGQQVATMLREMFYQYSNRSRRSQQKTMGPSQIGTPCDRKIVMHILGAPKVNPGGDNWAAFCGTQIHRGLEDMLKWADAGQGRFATEMRVKFNSALVPGGTLDALDRVLFMVDDHKTMGEWSLNKLRTKGPTPLQRTQVHLYGMGARQRGEKVDYVSLIGWPREEASLADLYVWVEPYDPQVARDALARVDQLKAGVDQSLAEGYSPQAIAESAPIADDCKFCPYHMKDASDLSNGACNGRR